MNTVLNRSHTVSRRLVHQAGIAAVLAIIVFLHQYDPDQWSSLATRLLHSLHGPGFALIAFVVHYVLAARYTGVKRLAIAGLTATGIGVMMEISQIPGARNAELIDLLKNSLGIVGGLGVAAMFDSTIRKLLARNTYRLIMGLSLVALCVSVLPTLWLAYAHIARAQALPVLLSFQHAVERAYYLQTELSDLTLESAPADWPIGASTIAKTSEAGQHGILLVLHPHPDWRGYSKLSFLAASTGGTKNDIAIGVRDMRPDQQSRANRFYTRSRIGPQPRRITITFDEILRPSAKRPFDFQRIEAVVLSAVSPGSGAEVLLDDFRLEP